MRVQGEENYHTIYYKIKNHSAAIRVGFVCGVEGREGPWVGNLGHAGWPREGEFETPLGPLPR
jgi:hypothetical protein